MLGRQPTAGPTQCLFKFLEMKFTKALVIEHDTGGILASEALMIPQN